MVVSNLKYTKTSCVICRTTEITREVMEETLAAVAMAAVATAVHPLAKYVAKCASGLL